MLEESIFFGVMISIGAYGVGCVLKERYKLAVFNPLLISIIIVMVILTVGNIDYDIYYETAKYLSYLLTPATICLAVQLYEKMELLKENWKAIMVGISVGVITSLGGVFFLSVLFKMSRSEYITMLPKSITTSIGIGIVEELNGYVTVTVAIIIITGILGNISAPFICKIFNITEPIAKGVAIGTSAHAIGTAKALEMGEIEGAMSSLAIVVSGLLTVIGASIFERLW